MSAPDQKPRRSVFQYFGCVTLHIGFDRKLRARDLRLFVVICGLVDKETGIARAPQDKLVAMSGYSRRLIADSLKRLIAEGWVEPIAAGRGERGRFKSTRYRVFYPDPPASEAASADRVTSGVHTDSVDRDNSGVHTESADRVTSGVHTDGITPGVHTDRVTPGVHTTVSPPGFTLSDSLSDSEGVRERAGARVTRAHLPAADADDEGSEAGDGDAVGGPNGDVWSLRFRSLRKRGGEDTMSDGSTAGDNSVMAVEMIREAYGDAEAIQAIADTKRLSGADLMFALMRHYAQLNHDPQGETKNGYWAADAGQVRQARQQPIDIDAPRSAGRLATQGGEP